MAAKTNLSAEISDFLKESIPLAVANGGTNLTALGTALQVLRVNAGGTALEYGAAAVGDFLKDGSVAMTGKLTLTLAAANAGILASTGYSLTGSDATSMIDLAGTWNTTGTPTALKLNITDTASNAASLFLDVQKNGTSLLSITKSAVLRIGVSAVNYQQQIGNSYHLQGSANYLGWGNSTNLNGTTIDLQLYRAAAATLQLGTTHATTPTAQTIKAHDVTTGTGASLTLKGGTGSVANGAVVLDGGNRAAFVADATDAASNQTLSNAIKAALISHGLMAAS